MSWSISNLDTGRFINSFKNTIASGSDNLVISYRFIIILFNVSSSSAGNGDSIFAFVFSFNDAKELAVRIAGFESYPYA